MKKLMQILTISSLVAVSSANIVACKEEIKNEITQNDVINQIVQFNGQTINLDDFQDVNYFDLSNKENQNILLNNLNLSLTEKSFISSINVDNNNFFIDTYKTIFFNVKKSLTSNLTDRIAVTVKWSNNFEENYNEQKVDAIISHISSSKELTIDDNTITKDNTSINLSDSIVQSAIFTNLNLDYNDLFYLESITDDNDNKISDGIKETITFTFKYLDIISNTFKTKSVFLDIIWNNKKPKDEILKTEIINQIQFKNIIIAKGINLSASIDINTKNNILTNVGLTKTQMAYVTIEGNLVENSSVNLKYNINIDSETTIYKNTIWYKEMPLFKNNYVTTISNYNNSIYFGTRKNGLWKYDDDSNNFINLINPSDLLDQNQITSLTNNSNKLYAGIQNMGISSLGDEDNLQASYYNSPNYTTSIFANDSKHFYVGSINQGLFRSVNNNILESYQKTNDNSTIYDIIVYHNETFAAMGTNGLQKGGIWDMSLKNPTQFPPSTTIPNNLNVYKLKIINNNLFAFTSKGIYILKGKTSSFVKLTTGNSILDNAAIIQELDNNNKLYLGTKQNGLWEINLSDLNNLNPSQIVNDYIKNNSQVTSLALDNDILWISFASFIINNNNSFYGGSDNQGLAFYCI